MLKRIVIIVLIISSMNARSYGQEKDTITLFNGGILIGEVQGARLGSLSIDDIDLKMINIKFFRIKTIHIIERFKIETVDKKYYYGTLKTAARPGWVDIFTIEGDTVQLHITKIYQLISVDNDFFKRLNGNVAAGLSFTKSSGIGQITFSANMQYATKVLDYQLSASSITSIDSGKFSRDNENLFLVSSYDLNTTWFLSLAGQYQRNRELSIARRWLGLTGIGNKLIIRKNWRLLATTGLTFSSEKSIEGVSSTLLIDVPLMIQFNFYQSQHPDIQISSTQTLYIGIDQGGRIRYDGNTSFSWQLIRYFYLNINPYTNFDSHPPAGSGSNFDYGIVFGLSYKF